MNNRMGRYFRASSPEARADVYNVGVRLSLSLPPSRPPFFLPPEPSLPPSLCTSLVEAFVLLSLPLHPLKSPPGKGRERVGGRVQETGRKEGDLRNVGVRVHPGRVVSVGHTCGCAARTPLYLGRAPSVLDKAMHVTDTRVGIRGWRLLLCRHRQYLSRC